MTAEDRKKYREIQDAATSKIGGSELVDYFHRCGILRTNPEPLKIVMYVAKHQGIELEGVSND